MVDIETLGTNGNNPVIQIGAAAFDIESGFITHAFDKTQDIRQLGEMNVDPNTLLWWLKTDAELLKTILTSEETTPTLIEDFHRFLTEIQETAGDHIKFWGNGILFDNRIIKEQMESAGLTYPIRYSKDRDVRTILDLAADKLGIGEYELKDKAAENTASLGLVKHNAIDDVIAQVNLVSYCYNILTKGRD